jgi:hypothetical protein
MHKELGLMLCVKVVRKTLLVTILDPKVANLSGRIEGKSNCVLLTTV